MGSALAKFFVDPSDLPDGFYGFAQVMFLLVVYGFILMNASNMISDGSELLLLVPSLAGIVGSVVLPVLGAVPDGAIVLFSGLGDNAQEELAVGVGALAGSTIMLLTIPWALSLWVGRVDIKTSREGEEYCPYTKPKLNPPGNWDLFTTGVQPKESIKTNIAIMLLTSVSYLLIQGPAFGLHCAFTSSDSDCDSSGEKYWALAGLVMCVIFFVGYLVYQVREANSEGNEDKIDQVIAKGIENGQVSLTAIFSQALLHEAGPQSGLIEPEHAEKRVKKVLHQFFKFFDVNNDNTVDEVELGALLDRLNETSARQDFEKIMKDMDRNKDGKLDFDEFSSGFMKLIQQRGTQHYDALKARGFIRSQTGLPGVDEQKGAEGDLHVQREAEGGAYQQDLEEGKKADAEEDEEEPSEEDAEMPEDLSQLPPDEQMRRVKLRAAYLLFVGTALVLIFSDPMVDVMSNIGDRLNIGSFYISFVLAPLASNASELIATIFYSAKKTKTTISISFSTLTGAGTMNNTFCLGIFLALIFFRGLAWEFSAECIAILFVEIAVAFIGFRRVQALYLGIVVGSLYPISILLVAVLEYAGLN